MAGDRLVLTEKAGWVQDTLVPTGKRGWIQAGLILTEKRDPAGRQPGSPLSWAEASGEYNCVLRLLNEQVNLTKDDLELQQPQRTTFNLDKLVHL